MGSALGWNPQQNHLERLRGEWIKKCFNYLFFSLTTPFFFVVVPKTSFHHLGRKIIGKKPQTLQSFSCSVPSKNLNFPSPQFCSFQCEKENFWVILEPILGLFVWILLLFGGSLLFLERQLHFFFLRNKKLEARFHGQQMPTGILCSKELLDK